MFKTGKLENNVNGVWKGGNYCFSSIAGAAQQ